MAEFGPNVTNVQPVQNFVTPKKGVVEEPGGLLALGNLIDTATGVLKSNNEKKANQTLADFTDKQLTAIQAVEQGQYSSRYARTLMRQNLIEAVNAYPSLREELLKTNSSIIGQGGMGEIITDGTLEEQRTNQIKDTLVSEGLVSPNASDEEMNSAYNEWLTAADAKRRYDAEMDALNLQEAQGKATDDQRARVSERYLIESAPAKLQEIDTKAKQILDDTSLSSGQKKQAIEAMRAQLLAEVAPYVAGINSTKADALMAAANARLDIYDKMSTEEYSRDEADQRLKHNQTVIQNRLFENESFALAYGMSKILPNQPLNNTLTLDVERLAQAFIMNSSENNKPYNPFSTDPKDRNAFRNYTDMLTKSSDSGDAEIDAERGIHLINILDGVTDYEGVLRRNPKAGVELVNYFASDGFLKLLQDYPDEAVERSKTAAEILEQNFNDEVWQLIRDEFREKKVYVGTFDEFAGVTQPGQTQSPYEAGQTDVTALVGYEATGAGMRFFALDQNNAEAKQQASQLNRELRPIINNVVRSLAHLQGRQDYGEVFKEKIPAIFDPNAEVSSLQDNTEGDLTLAAFTSGQSILKPEMANGGLFEESLDLENITSPADLASRMIGLSETNGKSTVESFIQVATGGNIDINNTAWCAAFLNSIFEATGTEGTGKLNARSYLNWGTSTSTPENGDVVVLWRNNPNSWQGHVGLYVGPGSKEGYIKVLGGNQGNAVSIKEFPANRVLGYRKPTEGGTPRGSAANTPVPSKSYTSFEEVEQAAENGEIKTGQIINLNGRLVRYE